MTATPSRCPNPCFWPDCLTPEEQDALAVEVSRQMLGEPPAPPGPDPRIACGCDDSAPAWDCEPVFPVRRGIRTLRDIDQHEEIR